MLWSNNMTISNVKTKGNKVIFFHIIDYHWEKLGQEPKQEPGGRSWSRPWRNTTNWYLVAHSTCFHVTSNPASLSVVLHTVTLSLPHQSLIKKNAAPMPANRLALLPIWLGHSLIKVLSFQMTPNGLGQVDAKLTSPSDGFDPLVFTLGCCIAGSMAVSVFTGTVMPMPTCPH